MSENGTLFDDDFLKKLEYLNLVSNYMVPGHLHGEHRAKRTTDAGIEFADYRQYVTGEDTKNVDWRTYLRLDKAHSENLRGRCGPADLHLSSMRAGRWTTASP